MKRTESIIAIRLEPIKNLFPLLPSIICPDVRDLILCGNTMCDTPCDCNYLLVFIVVFFLEISSSQIRPNILHMSFNEDMLWIIWRCLRPNQKDLYHGWWGTL